MLIKNINLPTNFSSLGIEQSAWDEKIDTIATLAFEDQCSPANPRVPMVEEMKEILVKAYNGYTKE